MKLTFGIGVFAIWIALASCEDPAANKTKAVVTNTSKTTVGTAAIAMKPTLRGEPVPIDPGNSKVLFTGSKVTGSHRGGFNRFAGVIDLVNESPTESSVTVGIETASVFTDAEGLTRHLLSDDFFEVAKFPTAAFASTKIEPKGGDGYTVMGELELHGQTKSIAFPATIRIGADAVDVDAEFSIDRKDFGISYTGRADDLIRSDVVIKLELKGVRKR